ncbi:endonuclease/exonuclease/phosphatase family protein [Natronorubrum halophilum]|uniref:endonuclease/exonuclease/phosphatase family protein n=1 Tax=Natronorubrum halophilum TaxID=1702106 RepID=UPI000EF653B4|nr:endonuclease/exonuclease/phosphatase family protein [Natronorubrum halophilum]
MKILSCNAGYLLGYQNILGGYVPPPVGSLLGDAETERRKLEQLVGVIERESPDVVSLLEVDRGSHRTITGGQFRTLVESLRERGLSYGGDVANKYGDGGIVELLPFFGHLANAVLSRTDRLATTHYLSAGRKRLVIEMELTADTVLFVVHLSLGARSRGRQLRQLAELIAKRTDGRDVIVTGDFNTFAETDELDAFSDRTGLETRVPGETVPSRPLDDLLVTSRSLDLFLCSPSIDVERCDVLDVQLSDHRPIVLETGR